jgi:hypothetical protein
VLLWFMPSGMVFDYSDFYRLVRLKVGRGHIFVNGSSHFHITPGDCAEVGGDDGRQR